MEQDRAVLFVDGNNWYHALKEVGATDLFQLDYAKVSKKIITPARAWAGTRYYIGRMRQDLSARLYADQRRFLARACKLPIAESQRTSVAWSRALLTIRPRTPCKAT